MRTSDKIGGAVPPHHSKGRPARPEDGDTLVEVLMTLIVLSLTVVALLVAFSTSLLGSAVHRNLAVSDTVLRSVSESVYSQFQQTINPVFAACPTATPSYYNNQLNLATPAPYSASYSATVTSVQYWNGASFAQTPANCTSGSTAPQQLTVQVIGPNGATESADLAVGGSGQITGNGASLLPQTITATVSSSSGETDNPVSVGAAGYSGTGTISYHLDSGTNGQSSSGGCNLSGTTLSSSSVGTCYVYVTIAADAVYLAASSQDKSVTFSSDSNIEPPEDVVVAAGGTTGSVVVTFDSVQGAVSYSCSVFSNSALTVLVASGTCSSSGTTFSSLGQGALVYVTVIAIDSGGNSSQPSDPESGHAK